MQPSKLETSKDNSKNNQLENISSNYFKIPRAAKNFQTWACINCFNFYSMLKFSVFIHHFI